MQVLQQKAQSRAVAQEQLALPSFGSSLTGQRRVAAPVSHGKAAMRVGAKIQRPTSRNNMTIMNVLEKPTIQYTETSRAKSSSVLGEGGNSGIPGWIRIHLRVVFTSTALRLATRVRRLPDQDCRGLSRVDLKAIHELSPGAVGVHCARSSCSCYGTSLVCL